MICNFYPFNFVISYTNKLPILWFISWYHSNNDWKYYNTFLQSCTFNQDLKEQKWQQDYVWSLNEKTYFKKPNVNATIFPYPLYTSIVYGCSIPHRHSDATQMDKMCVQFLYARRTFQIVAVKNIGPKDYRLKYKIVLLEVTKAWPEDPKSTILYLLYFGRVMLCYIAFYIKFKQPKEFPYDW